MSGEPVERAGMVAILGAPNAGKSTLVNAMVGAKVSIVSPKVQTTRSRVMGVCARGRSQIVLVDTPGVLSAPRRRLERAMVRVAWREAGDADQTLLVVDSARRSLGPDLENILREIVDSGRVPILVLNKIDAIRRDRLLTLAADLNGRAGFSATYMVSALTGDGLDDLAAVLADLMPPGPWLYPEDQLTDMPERLLAAELVREKLFMQLRQELPYALTVETEAWEPFQDGSVKIDVVIYVERDSQKAIVLGKGGQQIKAIGAAAREELHDLLGRKVHLYTFLKVRERWVDDPERYRDLGLDFNV